MFQLHEFEGQQYMGSVTGQIAMLDLFSFVLFNCSVKSFN